MLYLDYAKPLAGGGYILSFFADSAADLESISHGQKFVTKNGTDYGVPQAGSTVIVTSPNSGKTTYVMDAEGVWVVTEDISYSAVVANPSDAATAKLEKLKVNDTTYANWTENEIKALAGKGADGVSIMGIDTVSDEVVGDLTYTTLRALYSDNTTDEFVVAAKNGSSESLFLHNIKIKDSTKFYNVSFNAYSKKSLLTLEDAISLIGSNRIPAVFQYMSQIGTVAVLTYLRGDTRVIAGVGAAFNQDGSTVVPVNMSFTPAEIEDTLIGENL